MTRNKRIIVASVAVVLIFLLFYNFIFKPRTARIEELTEKYDTALSILETSRGYVSKYKSVRLAFDSISAEWRALSACLPEEAEMPILLREIAEAGRLSKVKFLLFKPLGGEATELYKKHPIEIRVSCNYHEVGYFLSRIALIKRLVNVQTLELTGATKKTADKLIEASFVAIPYTALKRIPVQPDEKSKGGSK